MSSIYIDLMGFVSVKSYEAKGDGVTDDTDCILAALVDVVARDLKSLYFPHGSYVVDSSRINNSNFAGIFCWGDNSDFAGITHPINQIGTNISQITTLLGLTDLPATYSGQQYKHLRVNITENAIEFVTAYTKSEIDALLDDYPSMPSVISLVADALTPYYTAAQIVDIIANYYTASQVSSLLTSYYTSAQVDNFAVKLSGNQNVAGVKTFSSSPIVPTPTTDMQAATKKYVDDNAGVGEVTLAGVQTLLNKTVSFPKIVIGFMDASGNGVMGFPDAGVIAGDNYFDFIAHADADAKVTAQASGSATNLDIDMLPKGNGILKVAGVDVNNKVVNQRNGTYLKTWVGTAAQYAAIGAKDSGTLYFTTV